MLRLAVEDRKVSIAVCTCFWSEAGGSIPPLALLNMTHNNLQIRVRSPVLPHSLVALSLQRESDKCVRYYWLQRAKQLPCWHCPKATQGKITWIGVSMCR